MELKYETENGSRGDFPLSVYHLNIMQNRRLSFIRLWTKKQTEVIHLQIV
jgi:hypothetical protein